nr:ABC transporter permease subunit [Bifidobacterium adolescentis]
MTNAYIYKLVARFFGYSPLMGPFIAVFAAYLWGTDYEYGTLRNKLICGHTREEVYFSNLLLTICAGLSTSLIWLIVNGMLGIPLLGTASLNLSLGEMAFYIFSSLLMVVALSSVCCLSASLAENKNSATLLCLGAVAAMVIIGMLLYDRFAEPELLDGCGVIQTQLCDGIPKISNSSVEHFVSCWNFLSV